MIKAGNADFLEIRVDHFADDPSILRALLPKLGLPLIITVRDRREGGAGNLTLSQRRALYAEFLPYAACIDVELRAWVGMADVVAAAQATGVKTIASAHWFAGTPRREALELAVRRAAAGGADICKIAAHADTAAELGRLLAILSRPQPLPTSVMAMGRFGKISRLLFAQAGSILNYGYLARPNASGQWEARLLKKRLAEVADEGGG